MVLEVAPDAGQLVAERDAHLAQVLRRADARQQQELGRADRPGGEDHLPIRPCQPVPSPPAAVAHAEGAAALELEPGDGRAGDELEVRALERRAQERVGGAPAAPVALRDLEHRRAVLLGPVVVGDHGDAGRGAGVEQAPVERPRRCSVTRSSPPARWNSESPRELSSERRK